MCKNLHAVLKYQQVTGGGVTFYVHPLCCASDAGLKKLDRATLCEYESLTVVVTILGNSKQR